MRSQGDEWEEKWSEYYHSAGHVSKWADKWGKQGPNVWHERWGEDYDPSNGGDACVKWTDKWAERLLPGGAREQWGDKWREEFGRGAGAKNGEVWTVGADGHRWARVTGQGSQGGRGHGDVAHASMIWLISCMLWVRGMRAGNCEAESESRRAGSCLTWCRHDKCKLICH